MRVAKPLKILYAAGLSPNDSSLYRLWVLERQGHTIVPLNSFEFEPDHRLLRKIVHRAQAGPWVSRLNHQLLAMAEWEKPDVFWADKLLSLQPRTLKKMRRMGIVSVSYMIDNVFGVRGDPGWRLYKKDLPYFDLHVVQRDKNMVEYREHGARDVMKIQTAYEPTIHYPPPAGWCDKDRDRGVSFIGTPYDQRAEFLTRLWKEFDLPVVISGGLVWKKALGPEATAALYRGNGELFRDEYREGIWRLTHAFEVWRVRSVCLHTDVRNQRSRNAIERIGGTFEGVLRAHRLAVDQSPRDSARFSITAAEWPVVRRHLEDLAARQE